MDQIHVNFAKSPYFKRIIYFRKLKNVAKTSLKYKFYSRIIYENQRSFKRRVINQIKTDAFSNDWQNGRWSNILNFWKGWLSFKRSRLQNLKKSQNLDLKIKRYSGSKIYACNPCYDLPFWFSNVNWVIFRILWNEFRREWYFWWNLISDESIFHIEKFGR